MNTEALARSSDSHGHIGRFEPQKDLWLRNGEACPECRIYGFIRVILKQRKRLFVLLRVYEVANKGLERWGCGMSYRLLAGRKKKLLM